MRQTTQKISLRPIALALALAFSSGAMAADKVWVGGKSDSETVWDETNNWTDGIPGTADDVKIGGVAEANQPAITTSVEVKSVAIKGDSEEAKLTVDANGELKVTNDVTVTGSSTTASKAGLLLIDNEGEVDIAKKLIITAGSKTSADASVTVTNGLLTVGTGIELVSTNNAAAGLAVASDGKLVVTVGGITLTGKEDQVATATIGGETEITGGIALGDYSKFEIGTANFELEGNISASETATSALLEFSHTSDEVELDNAISGNLDLTVSGSGGTTTLRGSTTYTGATTVSAGTLKFVNDGDLSHSVLTLTGGNLEFDNVGDTAKIKLAASESGVAQAGTIKAGETANLIIDLAAEKKDDKAELKTAIASEENLLNLTVTNTSAKAANLILSTAVQTYTGTTTVKAEQQDVTLTLGFADAIKSSKAVSLEGTQDGGHAILALTDNSQVNRLSGNEYSVVKIADGKALTVYNDDEEEADNSTFAGVIEGKGGLTHIGDGILTLSGANAYEGATTISDEGTLKVTGTLGKKGSGATPTYTYEGNIIITEADASLVLAQSANQTLKTGTISGAGSLVKEGEGTLTLSEDNTSYTGAITVKEGTLAIASDKPLGTGETPIAAEAAPYTLAGGTLELTGTGVGTGLTYAKDWELTNGTTSTIKATKNNTEFGGAIHFGVGENDTTLILVATGVTASFSGAIHNEAYGNLVVDSKNGGQVTLLSDANSYTGSTTVRKDSTLELAAGASLVNPTGEPVLTLEENATVIKDATANYPLDNGEINVINYATFDGELQANGTTLNATIDKLAGKSVLSAGASSDIEDMEIGTIYFDPSIRSSAGLLDVLNNLVEIDGQNVTDQLKLGNDFLPPQFGFLTEYRWTGGKFVAGAVEQAKALSEGFLGGIGLLSLGGDLITDKGISSATSSVARSGGAGEAFAAIGGGKVKHKTGSHVDVSGVSLVAGVAAGVGNGATVGAFVEYGDGDYDSSNSFSSGKVKGSGDAEYVGVGFLGRFDLPKTSSGQGYLEATARFGRVKSDFKTNDLQDAGGIDGARAKYDVKSNYHGLSLGGGHVWNVGKDSAVDLYGRYIWTRQAGDSANLVSSKNFDEKVKFSAVDSQRTRVGVRYSTAWSGSNRFYTGAAWEHEFDGKASARVVGAGKIKSPEMKGSTGIVEFGLVFTPADDRNLSIDLGIQAYGGKRSGATGSAQLKYAF